MQEPGLDSQLFRTAQVRSEIERVTALLAVFGCLALVLLARGAVSLAGGHRGETWPFALLLAGMTVYEAVWLRFVRGALAAGREVSDPLWASNILAESLLPTAAMLLQVHTPSIGPMAALTSPVVLAYFLLITLSTLHLNPALSRLAGGLSAAGYAAVAGYVLLAFPGIAVNGRVLLYSASVSYIALLGVGGFAAGAVARQIRLHVLAALRDAENRAKLAAIEHDLAIARSIQQGLLPKKPPAARGFDIAGWNRSADETGGDYFDWQPLPDGRLAVSIADVTGHGIGPALGMTACRAYARAGFGAGRDLPELFGRLNQLLYDDLPAEKFVTLAAGLLNPEDATLQLISAGHGPLLFYSAAGNCFQEHAAQGPPLGLLPGLRYAVPHALKFSSGDILVLVTDGFIEWANADGEEFGQQRVEEVIRNCSHMAATEVIGELYSAVARFAGAMPQSDDLTALIVKRL